MSETVESIMRARNKNNRLYRIYGNIKTRCYNKNIEKYKNYGGRGIKMCEEWFFDSNKFIEWALANGYQDNLTIDRIDVNGDYEPSNCRWIPIQKQYTNRTDNNKYKGLCICEWAKIFGISQSALGNFVRRNGWEGTIKYYTNKQNGLLARKNTARPVICIETNIIYPSIIDAAIATGLDPSNITKTCKGKRKQYKGYHWKYQHKED